MSVRSVENSRPFYGIKRRSDVATGIDQKENECLL